MMRAEMPHRELASDASGGPAITVTGVRQYGRVLIDTTIQVHSSAGRPTTARAHDIGCGGMSFYAPVELAEGDVVQLQFELPYSRMRFGVAAVVRNRVGFRYGVQFQQLTPDEFGEIARVTATLALSQA